MGKLKIFRKGLWKYKKSIKNSAIFTVGSKKIITLFLKGAQMRNVK